jgi:hypothetical protein
MDTINPQKLWTQAEYARKINKSRVWVNRLVKTGQVKTVKINGAELIYIR